MWWVIVSLILIAVCIGAWRFFHGEIPRMEGDHGPIQFWPRSLRYYAVGGVVIIWALITFLGSLVFVSPGVVKFPIWFGVVQQDAVMPGVHLRNPMYTFSEMPTRRETVDFSNDEKVGNKENPVNGPAILAQAADQNQLVMDVSFPYSVNTLWAWKLYALVGASSGIIEAKLLETSARTVTAEVAKSYPQAFRFSPAQIRSVRPDEKLINAVSEKLAAQQLLERQEILNKIAEKQVERRTSEGEGIEKMFAKLPKASAKDIATVLRALATKEMADATMKAVETGSVKLIVVNGNDTPVSVPSDAGEK